MAAPEETKVLLTWKSPSRPFKKRDKDFFTTIGAIVFLICVILLFIKEWFLIAAIVTLSFLVYVLNTVPPEEVEHKITNKGIVSAQKAYNYEDFKGFLFKESDGFVLLKIESKKGFLNNLILLIKKEDEEKIKNLLAKYLTFKEKEEENFLDKAALWLSKKIPLEK